MNKILKSLTSIFSSLNIEVEIYCFTFHRSFVRPISFVSVSFVSVRSLHLSCGRSNTRR